MPVNAVMNFVTFVVHFGRQPLLVIQGDAMVNIHKFMIQVICGGASWCSWVKHQIYQGSQDLKY